MDARQLLDALEMRLGAMDNRRMASTVVSKGQAEESDVVTQVISDLCTELGSLAAAEEAKNTTAWYETTFHPIDENDPMLQATKSLKW